MKTLKKAFLGGATAMIAILLVSMVHHYQLRSAVDHYKAELKASGQVMELSQALPPRVAAERNGTDIFRNAATVMEIGTTNFESSSDYFPGFPMIITPGKALIAFQQSDLRNKYSTNSWKELQRKLDAARPVIDLLSQLPDHSEFNFQIHYELGWKAFTNFNDLELVPLRAFNRCLNAAVIMDLHRDDVSSAIKHEVANLVLFKAAQSERFVISELVGFADLKLSFDDIWEILQSTQLTNDQLVILQQRLEEMDLTRTHEDALNMENINMSISLKRARQSTAELKENLHLYDAALESLNGPAVTPSFYARAKESADIFRWRYWWSYSDDLNSQRGFKIMRDSLDFARTSQNYLKALERQEASLETAGLTNREDWLFGGEPDLHSMLSSSTSELSSSFRRVMTAETSRQIVITAIALKRFQLKHGQFPQNLSELIPEFLASATIDPMSGEPLHYRRQLNDTFLLYSVGENGVDDGGDPTVPPGVKDTSFDWQNRQSRDWVWPQAATPAEIQNFRDHPPK